MRRLPIYPIDEQCTMRQRVQNLRGVIYKHLGCHMIYMPHTSTNLSRFIRNTPGTRGWITVFFKQVAHSFDGYQHMVDEVVTRQFRPK